MHGVWLISGTAGRLSWRGASPHGRKRAVQYASAIARALMIAYSPTASELLKVTIRSDLPASMSFFTVAAAS